MSLKSVSDFLWGVSDMCFSAYHRLQRFSGAQSNVAHTSTHLRIDPDMTGVGDAGHFLPGPLAHNPQFVSVVDRVAHGHGYQTEWDPKEANLCFVGIPADGETYILCLSLDDIGVLLTHPSKLNHATCPRNMDTVFSRRNQELEGVCKWKILPNNHFVVSALLPVYQLEKLPEVMRTVAAEVVCFDRVMRRQGHGG